MRVFTFRTNREEVEARRATCVTGSGRLPFYAWGGRIKGKSGQRSRKRFRPARTKTRVRTPISRN